MIDSLLNHKGLVTVFTHSWTWGDAQVQDADESGILITVKGKSQAVPWAHIKNIELIT